MRNEKAAALAATAALAAMIGLSGGLNLPMPRLARKPRWFGVPKDQPLNLRQRDKSQHNTLRLDQVERRRKYQRRQNRLTWGRYRRAPVGDRHGHE